MGVLRSPPLGTWSHSKKRRDPDCQWRCKCLGGFCGHNVLPTALARHVCARRGRARCASTRWWCVQEIKKAINHIFLYGFESAIQGIIRIWGGVALVVAAARRMRRWRRELHGEGDMLRLKNGESRWQAPVYVRGVHGRQWVPRRSQLTSILLSTRPSRFVSMGVPWRLNKAIVRPMVWLRRCVSLACAPYLAQRISGTPHAEIYRGRPSGAAGEAVARRRGQG
jgi:hypothetical protein